MANAGYDSNIIYIGRYLPLVEKVTLKNLIIYDVANSLVGISTRNLRLAR